MKTVDAGPLVALLVFEAAGCLMAVPASEIARLGKGSPSRDARGGLTPSLDLDEMFTGKPADGPWLDWSRGSRRSSLRVRRVVEVISCAIGALTPMPFLLRRGGHTAAFRAAGVQGDEVFLLLDPARLLP